MSKASPQSSITAEEYLFEFTGYLVTCAEMALSPRGSPRYSALRFVEATRRLIDLPSFVHCLNKDPFLLEIRKKLDQLKIEQNEMDQLRNQLKTLLLEFAEEASRRGGQRSSP